MLHQHPDGLIFVRDGSADYGAMPDKFRIDYGDDLPPLPEGITERIYEPGVCHALKRGSDVVDGGPLVWPEGDAAIAQANELVKKRNARELAAFEAYKRAIRQGETERQMALSEKTKEQSRKMQADIKALQEQIARNPERKEELMAEFTRTHPPITIGADEDPLTPPVPETTTPLRPKK